MFGPGRGRGGLPRNDRPTEWYTAQSPRPRPMQSQQRGLYGRGFPSRGGYNHWRSHHQARDQEPTRGILDDLVSEPQQTISDPSTDNVEDIEAQDVRYIASYTWTDAKQPTIIVPGSPRVWRDLPLPFSVSADTGETYAYSNSHKLPTYPFLPLFRAIDALEESGSTRDPLDWSAIDFITDRNNLRKLLSWVEFKAKGSRVDDFRIDMQLCGIGTVILQRWEPRAVYESENSGFGDSFERETTRPGPGCEAGILAGHNRVISYTLHGMKLVVRCEVDACSLPDQAATSTQSSIDSKRDQPAVSVDDLADALSSLAVATPESPSTDSDVTIVKGGFEVPQSSLIKIKTRSTRNMVTFDWDAAYLQLFLGQTYNLHLGVHQRGNFETIRKVDFESTEMQQAAKRVQPVLKMLGRLLDEILYIAIEYGQKGRLSLVCKSGQLKVHERKDEASFLPDDILGRFE